MNTGKAGQRTSSRYITFNGCRCNGLQCDCCVGIDLANSPHHEVCLIIQIIPNEVTLKGTIRLDGNDIYTGQLDPSVAPVCLPPLPSVCLAINHVDLQKRQACTKLTFVVFTLVKFPCIGQQNGQLVVEANTYV
ncbi:hypothetical protein NQ314_007393 [Rhamnusium bicolor]|uniref:DUF4773 domain-containing protein n=1 Tax=Rhamnusium bicolor TaxID=1586634 RepID=A0AAV8YQY2_9CUCU|nr:hypothetical protein NQ314_007393 [Rhamnusium bicolor]